MVVDFLVLIIMYVMFFYPKKKKLGKAALLVNTLMYVYLSFVLYFTLMPIITSLPYIFNHPYIFMNLSLFSDLAGGKGDFIRQIVLNVVMMIPFGLLFPLTQSKRNTFIKTVLYTFILSLAIELIQPLLNGFRSSDITDLVTNTLGGVIGYIGYVIFRPSLDKFLNCIKGYDISR